MCLTIDPKNNIIENIVFYKPTIATHDITVWKYGRAVDDKFISPFMNSVYYPNKVTQHIKIVPKFQQYPDSYRVDEGYHAYISRSKCKDENFCQCIERFIIPAGSEYFMGIYGDIVASQIMWSPESKFDKFKRKLNFKNK